MKKNVTFFTVIGGAQHYRDATTLAVNSIIKKIPNAKIKVFDFDNKFCHEKAETVDCRGEIRQRKNVGYTYWRQKYCKAREVDTEYGVYFDCDTVLVNDYFDEIFDQIGGKIGSAKHWWTPTYGHFKRQAVSQNVIDIYDDAMAKLGVDDNLPYYAGGVFLFKKSTTNMSFFSSVIDWYDQFNMAYDSKEECNIVTDEFFFSGVFPENMVDLGGSLNVCPKGNNISTDLLVDCDGELLGKNCFDDELSFNPVIFIHCNLHKGNPIEGNYPEDVKEIIKQHYGI